MMPAVNIMALFFDGLAAYQVYGRLQPRKLLMPRLECLAKLGLKTGLGKLV